MKISELAEDSVVSFLPSKFNQHADHMDQCVTELASIRQKCLVYQVIDNQIEFGELPENCSYKYTVRAILYDGRTGEFDCSGRLTCKRERVGKRELAQWRKRIDEVVSAASY